MSETLVFALGGNTLLPPGHLGSIPEQRKTLHHSLSGVAELLRAGHRVVIAHGNGPQVGHILVRAEAARGRAYELPIDVAVAQTQGEMGFLIQQALRESFHRHGIERPIVTVVTQVLVDRADPGFRKPSKPVGPWYLEAALDRLKERGWTLAHDAEFGWRRLVPSPMPQRIVELEAIRRLLDAGAIVIAGGGGGIPVFAREGGAVDGVEAVLEKDHTASLLATAVNADRLILLTGVDRVRLNYGRNNESPIGHVTARQMNAYAEANHFPAGTMGPKVDAALRFLQKGGREAIITLPEKVVAAFDGRAGTRITLEP